MRDLRRRALSAGVGLAVTAAAFLVVVAASPAAAARPGTCPVGGPGGFQTASISQPESPFSATPGLTLPRLDVAPVPVHAVLSPGPGETFAPITLVEVQATPTAKVRRDNTIDPDHALMMWRIRVNQYCPDTRQDETCDYFWEEMPDGRIFQVLTLPDGTQIEHAFHVECQRVRGFRAVAAPVDLGARQVAAARAQLTHEQLHRPIIEAMRYPIITTFGVPGIALPTDATSWGAALPAALATASGVAGLVGGACFAAATATVGAEISAWLELSSVATVPAAERMGHAVAAVIYKIAATVGMVFTHTSCVAQIGLLPFGSALAVFYLALDLGTAAVWGISVASYLGLLAAAEVIEIWSS